MPTHALARFLTVIALLAASASWAGWLLLHTVGDPGRAEVMATAVLSNPAARSELGADIAGPFAAAATTAGYPVAANDPTLRAAVSGALANPAVGSNITAAIAAAQRLALGDTAAPAPVIDTALLAAAIRQQLATSNPALADELPTVGSGALTLPTIKIPYVHHLRALAQHWSGRLAGFAVAALVAALVLGDRARVLRRAGLWGVGAGLSWVLVPRLITWSAGKWAAGQASMISAVVHGAAGAVTAAATGLVVVGLAAILASLVGATFAHRH